MVMLEKTFDLHATIIRAVREKQVASGDPMRTQKEVISLFPSFAACSPEQFGRISGGARFAEFKERGRLAHESKCQQKVQQEAQSQISNPRSSSFHHHPNNPPATCAALPRLKTLRYNTQDQKQCFYQRSLTAVRLYRL